MIEIRYPYQTGDQSLFSRCLEVEVSKVNKPSMTGIPRRHYWGRRRKRVLDVIAGEWTNEPWEVSLIDGGLFCGYGGGGCNEGVLYYCISYDLLLGMLPGPYFQTIRK